MRRSMMRARVSEKGEKCEGLGEAFYEREVEGM